MFEASQRRAKKNAMQQLTAGSDLHASQIAAGIQSEYLENHSYVYGFLDPELHPWRGYRSRALDLGVH